MKPRFSSRNWITIIGAMIAAINLLMIIILFLISTIFHKNATYVGLFIYIVLPGFMLLGLIMIPVGMLISRKKMADLTPDGGRRLPAVDLNNPKHKRAFLIFTGVTIIVLFLSTYGSFEAYHLTESVEFCGTLCHKVMEPEHTAYQNSSHANVGCVECHVGSGASWYVKSKLSGLHQVYAVIANDYETPIETPLHDLRPARETCERCHWPQKFYSRNLQTNKYYLADSLNTEWDITLQMKIGSEYSDPGFNEGIHWHINQNVNIEYISDNDKREQISYVKYTNKETGEVAVYKNPDIEISDSLIASTAARTMDCIDCHNRPSHNYYSPPVYFDKAMLANDVSKDIPYIKRTAMGVLYDAYSDRDTALMEISNGIINYYKSDFGTYFEENQDKIEAAVGAIQKAYSQNAFPAMKVAYDAYPDHIGHLETEGCFRCHNDAFVSESGRKITKDCNLCHTIIAQGNPNMMEYTNIRDTLEFIHPIDVGTSWREFNCSECHKYLY
jgi:nitrate/TMAO reductase-like tetraheme cytochrome c subunit